MTFIATENGPCQVNADGKTTVLNPNSWNTVSNSPSCHHHRLLLLTALPPRSDLHRPADRHGILVRHGQRDVHLHRSALRLARVPGALRERRVRAVQLARVHPRHRELRRALRPRVRHVFQPAEQPHLGGEAQGRAYRHECAHDQQVRILIFISPLFLM